ncbi:MAG: lysoplasmalogenase [Betaproteobacteria bacterium]
MFSEVASNHAPLRRALLVVGAIAAVLAIASAPWALDRPSLNFAFKPLATLCVIAWALLGRSDDAAIKRWIVAGLGCSLAGDIALLWPVQGFMAGLVAFLLGHVAYLVALTRRVRLAARLLAFVAWALVAAGVLGGLWHGVPGELRVPVVVYVCALAAMAAQGTTVWLVARGTASAPCWRVVAIGGALFVLSDAILATDKFVGGIPLPTLFNLSIYWLAQWCIARAAGSGTQIQEDSR